MSDRSRTRRTIIIVLLFLLALLALLFSRCTRPRSVAPTVATATTPTPPPASPVAATPAPAAALPEEILTPATLQLPAEVVAGATFAVGWTGPNNIGDFVTLVEPNAAASGYGSYTETKKGSPLDLTAPLQPGAYEVRYVTSKSRTVLARAPLTVTAVTATLTAPAEAVLGTPVSISWTGPNYVGDYITVVTASLKDGAYQGYTETVKGNPLQVAVPVEAGDAEIRYMTGQGARVLARRPIKIVQPELSLKAPDEIIAGKDFSVEWTGPNNRGDYITLVPKSMPDGQYANYKETTKGSPLVISALITPGPAELRYMTGTGAKVLARRPMNVVAAVITLEAPATITAGERVSIAWTGPNNRGDYITVVPVTMPDGQYAGYIETTKGSPVAIATPKEPSQAEIRYMSGQGARVLARRPLTLTAP